MNNMLGTTNALAVIPDRDGSMGERLAQRLRDCGWMEAIPSDRKEIERLVRDLEAKPEPKPEASVERWSSYFTAYNAALHDASEARRLGLRPKDWKLPACPDGGTATPDELTVLQQEISDLGEDLENFKSQTADQRRIGQIEARLNRVFPTIIEHINKQADKIAALEAEVTRHRAVIALGPRPVGPMALTAVPEERVQLGDLIIGKTEAALMPE